MPLLTRLPDAPRSGNAERAERPPFVRAFEGELDYVFRTFRRLGFAEPDAEDLAQEVFVVMWRRWNEYDPARPLRPWLAGIAYRVAQHHRRKRREVLGALVEMQDEGAGPHEHLAAARARTLVLQALAGLPERHRAPLVLSDLDGLTMPAVAEALSVPLATAYTRVRRARLAFADEVARLEKGERQEREQAGVLPSVEALLAYERPVPALLVVTRRRVMARAQASLRPPVSGPRLTPTSLSLGAAGIVALVSAGALVVRPAASTATVHAAALPVTAPADSPVRAGDPVRDVVPASGAPRPVRLAAGLTSAETERGLARGLSGYWRFDEGETATHDLSSSARDCQIRGLDPARAFAPDGVHGNALALHGRGWLECTTAASDATPGRELSVAAWVQPNRPTTFHRSILSREVTPSSFDDLFLGFSGANLEAGSKSWGRLQVPHHMTPGRWTHLAATQRPDGLVVLYIDGVEVARKQVRLQRPARGARRLLIAAGFGSSGQKVSQKFHGMIDELVMYDRALSPTEVAALAAGTQPALSD
jgi:RNA polymerase sigma-70 factor (ECF subfamily)